MFVVRDDIVFALVVDVVPVLHLLVAVVALVPVEVVQVPVQ